MLKFPFISRALTTPPATQAKANLARYTQNFGMKFRKMSVPFAPQPGISGIFGRICGKPKGLAQGRAALGMRMMQQNMNMAGNMASSASSRAPRVRVWLVALSIIFVVLLILRSFANVRFRGSLVHDSKRSMEIRILTFNIWRSTEKMRERMEALGEIVEDLEPDLVTFQEVTRDNLAILQEQRWFSRYHLVLPDVAEQERPELAILSSYPVEKWQVYPFQKSDFPRQRRIVVAETSSSSASTRAKFVIAATHLVHSGFNTKLREEQLKESVKIISD